MALADDYLGSDQICSVLDREHGRAQGDTGRLDAIRAQIDAAKADGTFSYDLYPDDVYLAIEPAMGRFLYLAACAIGAKRIVEFGTSFGISTIYLAAAARQAGGSVIGTEMVPEKAEHARANLAEAGLAGSAEIRIGDAMETLKGVDAPVDILFLDGWKDLYMPVLEMLEPVLRPGAIVAADNIWTFRDELEPYMAKVSERHGRYESVLVPFGSGLGFSIVHGGEHRNGVLREGRLSRIARKSERRAPVEILDTVAVTADGGLEGDNRGLFAGRAVTVLAREGWAAALTELELPADTDWTLRRANLLVEGVSLPRAPGGVLAIGEVLLETTGETRPCSRMEEQRPGLQKALAPDWRGGVTCRVLKDGEIRAGDPVQLLVDPPARTRAALPG